MNTPYPYERRIDRRLDEAAHPSELSTSDEHSALAVHRDPSQHRDLSQPGVREAGPGRPRRSIAWVRPSDLPTVIGSPMVGRGIDVQAELLRRARRSPVTAAARARHRISRTAIARPEPVTPTATTREGWEL